MCYSVNHSNNKNVLYVNLHALGCCCFGIITVIITPIITIIITTIITIITTIIVIVAIIMFAHDDDN